VEYLTTNFSRDEFACKGENCCGHSSPISLVLVTALQTLRNAVGQPIHVTSGFRCNIHNLKVAKTEFSQHTLGNAADIYWGEDQRLSPEAMREEAEKILAFYDGGIGVYYDGIKRIHVDIRSKGSARW
jgi:zinc D-Ala-D-Ala carboxypeptidase